MLELRYLFLVLVCFQNSAYTILRRYSRGVLKETYSPSSVLGVAELLKFVLAATLVEAPNGSAQQASGGSHRFSSRRAAVMNAVRFSRPMAVPAVTYLVMNVLSFLAMSRIDATVFAMIAQLKILMTAVFSQYVLGRSFSRAQWRAIFLLTLAVAIITYSRGHHTGKSSDGGKSEFSLPFLIGCSMVMLEVTLSGWISTYFERYLKDGSFSVWGRNLQLSVWSMLMYAIMELGQYAAPFVGLGEQIATKDSSLGTDAIKSVEDSNLNILAWCLNGIIQTVRGFFGGWSIIAVILCLLGGAGGIFVAFATMYADAVAKAMAAAFALVLVVAVDICFLGASADPVVCMSALVAIIAMQNYQEASQQATREPHQMSSGKSPPVPAAVTPAPIGARVACKIGDLVGFSNPQASRRQEP